MSGNGLKIENEFYIVIEGIPVQALSKHFLFEGVPVPVLSKISCLKEFQSLGEVVTLRRGRAIFQVPA